jgi:helix-turn-helix protein
MGCNFSLMSIPWGRTPVSESEESQRVGSAEAEIIRQAQHGDAEAFERIYQLHSRRIYALCLRIVRNPTETEDLTQERSCACSARFTCFAANRPFPSCCTDWLSTQRS